jgi:transcriptional regulator with XRE-family HTH domain
MNPLNRRFAENLFFLRNHVDLSQAATAERSGLHRTEISLLERGLRLPRLDTIVRLGGALEVEPCELMVGMGWRLPRRVEERAAGYGRPDASGFAELDRSESP